MNKFNKMKSFLFDEEEEEKEKPVKKINKKAHVDPKNSFDLEKTKEMVVKKDIVDELYFEDVSEEKSEMDEIKTRISKSEKEYGFPMDFDDDDFVVSRNKTKSIVSQVDDDRSLLYQGSKKKKEEVKRFKPTPIISPVYGLLDKNGEKVESPAKIHDILKPEKEEVTFDEIRNKAYGKVDKELEDTLKKLKTKTLEQAENDELSRVKNKASEHESSELKLSKVKIDNEEDDMILPSIKFKEIDVDIEKDKNNKRNIEKAKLEVNEEDEDDTKEQDLFNLIDTMYAKEGDDN
ncbi:MAG: hypothetical protein RSB54_00055 [Bacilli bacterium]